MAQSNKHPITCVATFIRNEFGEYLIGVRKAKTSQEGITERCIPGGKIDWKESPEAAAIRETKEETGLDIKLEGFLGVGNDVWANLDHHFITLYYLASIVGGKLEEKEPTKLGEWEFLPKDKIPKLFATASTIVPILP